MATINHLQGYAFAKKKGNTIHVFEGPHTLADFMPVIAEGSDVPRMLKDRFADVVNVRDFGAKGNGTTDDTEAIQAAMTTGGNVFFPKGKYVVSKEIVVEGAANVIGRSARILDNRTPSPDGLTNLFVVSAEDVSFKGLSFELNSKSAPTNPNGETCIHFVKGSGNVSVEGCYFKNYVQCVYSSTDNDGLIKNISIRNNVCDGYDFAFLLDDFDGCVVEGNIGRNPENTRQNSIEDTTRKPPHLLYVTDRSGSYKRNLVVSNNIEINNAYSSAFKVRHTEGVVVVGNRAAQTERGIEINDCSNVVVSGNSVSLSVAADSLNDSAQNGIWLYGVQNASVSSNVVEIPAECGAISIRLSASDGGLIGENQNIDIINNCLIYQYTDAAYTYPFHVSGSHFVRIEGNTARNTANSPRRPSLYRIVNSSDITISGTVYSDKGSAGNYSLVYAENSQRVTLFINRELFGQGISPYANFSEGNTDCRVLDGGTVQSRSSSSSPDLRLESNTMCGISAYGSNGLSIYAGNKNADSPVMKAVIRALVSEDGHPRTYFLGDSVVCDVSDSVRPNADQEASLGSPSNKWTELYAATGTINTSDQRVKSSVASASDTLLDAVGSVPIHTFQFTDAVEKKGADTARFHAGVIAQEVASAFQAKGLDAARYGLFCYDTWQDEYETVEVVDQEEVVDDEGNVVTPRVTHTEQRLITAAGDRYGIRYEELLMLECARLRRELQRMKIALTDNGIKVGDAI